MRTANAIEELQRLQDERGHLAEADLRALSRRAGLPLHELEAVASFYPHFRRTPPAPVRVGVCRDLSCQLRDGGRAHRELVSLCAGRDDVELEETSCPGLCDRAPACLVNDHPAAPDAVAGYLADPDSIPTAFEAAAPRRWESDPYENAAQHYGALRELLESRDFDGAIARLAASGLRGMGGAGFPTGRKWELVREQPAGQKYVICNADESEPGAFKDRLILEELPHLVVEGLALAALCVGADRGIAYVRHEYGGPTRALQRAIDAAYAQGVLGPSVLGSELAFELEVFVSPST